MSIRRTEGHTPFDANFDYLARDQLKDIESCAAMLKFIDHERERLRDRDRTIRIRARELVEKRSDNYKQDHYYDLYDPELLTLDVINVLKVCDYNLFHHRKGAIVPAKLMEQWWVEEVMAHAGGKEEFIRLLSDKVMNPITRAGVFTLKQNTGMYPIRNCPLEPVEGAEFIKFLVLKEGKPYAFAMITNKGDYPVSVELVEPEKK